MRGLPWSASEADVAMFFSGLDIIPGGIHLIHDHTGRPSGVAYVEFSSPEEVHSALQRHNGFIGSRYIEVMCETMRAPIAHITRIYSGISE